LYIEPDFATIVPLALQPSDAQIPSHEYDVVVDTSQLPPSESHPAMK
jgi:hypothetical protein